MNPINHNELQHRPRQHPDCLPVSRKVASRISHPAGNSALVLNSPHSGTDCPIDIACACDLPPTHKAEDTPVDKLYSFAPALVAHWVEAHFPRSDIDANRNNTDVDVSLFTSLGLNR